MTPAKTTQSALISAYHKEGLEPLVKKLAALGVKLYATDGSAKWMKGLGCEVTVVESLTGYPAIFGGRVKTLHPAVFGGILFRRDDLTDQKEQEKHQIPVIDFVVVDLYPFEDEVKAGSSADKIIEKIDIGGVALIRAAAKNYQYVTVVTSKQDYASLTELLETQAGATTLEQRKSFAGKAFSLTAAYDTAISQYFNPAFAAVNQFKQPIFTPLRYGENPHQKGVFQGNLNDYFTQLHGKELSYNNLVDIHAALLLVAEFTECTFAILKHSNPCGISSRKTPLDAWKAALACDPKAAFGGVLICNTEIDADTATEINTLFFEVLIAPAYTDGALVILKKKPNSILLLSKRQGFPATEFKSLLGGYIEQERDAVLTWNIKNMPVKTDKQPTDSELSDLDFAAKVVKHGTSNAIVIAKNKQILGAGFGQTARITALKQAIDQAKSCEFCLTGSVMASDAFFPFPDCVEMAHLAGITAIIQPGGSKQDQLSIDCCNKHQLSMVCTGQRMFKH